MVKLKFIVLDGVLALRISENKPRYYKRVTHLLKGKPNLEKHWVKEKERIKSAGEAHMRISPADFSYLPKVTFQSPSESLRSLTA